MPPLDPPASALLRTLRRGERDELLALLDGWPLRDGWRGRDFFRRYLEDDPEFRDENVWVAEHDGALVSCVQIFPRRLRSTGGDVACGGIGTVFTAHQHRGRGLASSLLARAGEAMRERGMEVSLLIAGRVDWYSALGWHAWAPPHYRLARRRRSLRSAGTVAGARSEGGAAAVDLEILELRPRRDGQGENDESMWLERVRELAERTGAGLFGTVARGAAGWTTSLRLAGNPDEHFRIACRGEREPVAFARACRLDGKANVTEWAYAPGEESALVTLLERELSARGALALPPVRDGVLFAALAERGLDPRPARGAAWMLRCLDPRALRRRLGDEGRGPADGTLDERALLERLFPRARFGFWTADRF
jgi:GNAT superfamily N-acetyltransferase